MKRPTYKSQPRKWREHLNTAIADLAEGRPDGFRHFLDNHAVQLSYKELINARNTLFSALRNKTSRVLTGAALKSHARKNQGLFKELQGFITVKKETYKPKKRKNLRLAKLQPKPKESAEEVMAQYLKPLSADELLERIESAETRDDIEKAFNSLSLSRRIKETGKRRYRITNEGQSSVAGINYKVNQELCRVYRLKLQEINKAHSEAKKQKLSKAPALNLVRSPNNEVRIAGERKVYNGGDVELEVIEGDSKKGNVILQVISIKGGNIPKVQKGNIYQLNSLPLELKYIMFPEEKEKDRLKKQEAEEARTSARKEAKKKPNGGEKVKGKKKSQAGRKDKAEKRKVA